MAKRKKSAEVKTQNLDHSDGESLPNAVRKIVNVLGIARSPSNIRLGIAVEPRKEPKRLHILDVKLTSSQNKSALTDWILDCEIDDLLDLGTKSLGAALRDAAQGRTVVVVDMPGYHRITIGEVPLSAYAWRNRLYFLGASPDFKVLTTGAAADTSPSLGDWKRWIEAIQPIAKANPRLLVALCVALSAALLRAFGLPSFTLALWAPTTKGKSTVQLVCSALTGPPTILQWRGTGIGVQEELEDHPDQPFCLDDAHKADKSEDIAQLVMAAGNGSARLISKRSAGARPPREIHSLPIISSEKSLAGMMGNSAAGGLFARLFEIGVGKFGMFDDLCGHADGASLSDHLQKFAEAQYGTVWPRWLKILSKSWPAVEKSHRKGMPKLHAAILTAASDPELDDITKRVVKSLTFAAFAGSLATKLKLWKMSDRRISAAFGLLLKEHLDRAPTGNPFAESICEAVAGCLETNRDKFHQPSAAKDPDRGGRWGYLIDDDRHEALYLFIPSVFRKMFVKQFGDEVFEALRTAGYLVCHSSRHNRFVKRLPTGTDGSKPMSFVAIKASIRYAKSI